MKLIRAGAPGYEIPGLLLSDGRRVDASGFGSDYDEAFFGGDGLARLAEWAKANAASAPVVAPSSGWPWRVISSGAGICLCCFVRPRSRGGCA